MSTEYLDQLWRAFHDHATAPAIRHAGAQLSYAGLDSRARTLAAGLEDRGVGSGDRVVCVADPSVDVVALALACHLVGATYVPANSGYRERELGHIVEDCRPRLLVTDMDADRRALAQAVAGDGVARVTVPDDLLAGRSSNAAGPEDGDTALIIYTSGTTGRSKGAQISFRALIANMLALTGVWRFAAGDRLVLSLPLFHVHGLCIGVHGALLRGATILLRGKFNPADVVTGFRDDGGTVFMGVPTMYRRLIDHLAHHPHDAEALGHGRLFTSGSAALSAADHAEFEQLTGHRILERYGMTETLITLSNPHDGERRAGSVGLPVPGCEARVVDDDGEPLEREQVGELEVRGDSLMTGYFGQDGATAAAWRHGWFRTGDVASRDRDGYFRIVGRRSVDVIKRAGFKISAREIEEVLLEHPAVREVAVVGLPDRELGERIAAAVVAQTEGVPELDLEIASLAKNRLAAFKCPQDIVFVDALPRNALGKLQKHRVRELIDRATT